MRLRVNSVFPCPNTDKNQADTAEQHEEASFLRILSMFITKNTRLITVSPVSFSFATAGVLSYLPCYFHLLLCRFRLFLLLFQPVYYSLHSPQSVGYSCDGIALAWGYVSPGKEVLVACVLVIVNDDPTPFELHFLLH